MTPRTPPRALQAEDIRLRRARLRDAPRVGLVVARTNEAQARDGRRRLNRVRAASPPRPLRHGLLFVAATLTAAAAPTWIGTTADDTAVVTVCPLPGPDRRRFRCRQAATTATIGIGGGIALFPLGLVHPLLLVALMALAAIPITWATVSAAREARACAQLRRRMHDLAAEVDGPVYVATNLAGGGRGAGTALVRTLTAWADVEGITLLGRTERGPLVALYGRHGFSVAAQERCGGDARPHRPPAGGLEVGSERFALVNRRLTR